MNEIVEYCESPESFRDSTRAKLVIARRVVCSVALALLPIALWCLTHRYRGLVGDSELYAVQALSRTDAGLSRDVFLSNSSQDRFTIFSPIYAFIIKILGLRVSAIALLAIFKICFYGAAWAFSRRLFDARTALFTTVLLVASPIEYGAYHVFHVAEDMLTARSAAEALAMAGLCLHVYGRRAVGLAVVGFALCVHALMALPMVLLLVGLRLSVRGRVLWAAAIVTVVLCAASAAMLAPHWTPGFLSPMDPAWLEVVRERSQFVFLQYWTLDDWELTARPFISLALGLLVIPDARIRALCATAMIVGAAGLAVAFVAGTIGPVAILLQGQAWRWVWVAGLIGLLMLAPTALQIWRSERCGSLCTVLLLVGWLLSLVHGVYFITAALCLWCGRKHIPPSVAPYLRFAATAIGALVFAWIIANSWTILSSPLAESGTESKAVLFARNVLGLDCLPIILAFLLGQLALHSRSIAVPAAVAIALSAAAAFAAPGALKDPRTEDTNALIEEFADWRDAIPPGENVFVAARYYSAGFAWFTLQRPSYLTVDQSAGAIFSRATALEVRRRSEVLRPIEESDWRLLSRRTSHGDKFDASAVPLTREHLVQICVDPELNFVVAREDVGFEPMRHRRRGPWNNWNLYDCKQVNSLKDAG
jgi:hypothetical protein